MLVGLLVIPILPGLVIIWVAALGYGLAAGFGTLGWIMFAILTVLMLAGSIVDNILMGTSAHKEGAPWWVILLAMAGSHHRQFPHSHPDYRRDPGGAADLVRDRMAPPQGLAKSPGFHKRNVDRLGMGICDSVYNWNGHDRPVAHLGLGMTLSQFQ